MNKRKKFKSNIPCLAVFTSKCLADMFLESFQLNYSNAIALHIDEDTKGNMSYYVFDLDCKNE